MTAPKKKAKKKSKKLKLDKETMRIAALFEKAWHELYYKHNKFVQSQIVKEPEGRHANDHAHDVAKLVEAWEYEREHGSFNDGPNEWKD